MLHRVQSAYNNGGTMGKKDLQKWHLFFGVLTAGLFLLSACGKTDVKDTDNGTLAIESVVDDCDFEYFYVAESERGYYFWEFIDEEHPYPRLMFVDKESGQVVPLCNKPDCTHEGRECNAYYPGLDFGKDGIAKYYLQYYDESLYALGVSADDYVTLFRIEEDGSEWEISTKLYRTDYAGTGHWKQPEILLVDGFAYFVDWKQKVMKLERVPIGGGTAEVLFEGDSEAPEVQIYRVKSYDGTVFFQAHIFVDENIEHAAGGLYQYDVSSNQCRMIKEGLVGPYSIRNDFVYYGNEEGLCRYSIQDESTEILADQPMNVPNIILTRENIFVYDQMGDNTLTAYDYEGKEVFRVTEGLKPTRLFCGNSKIMFGERADEIGLRQCYLDLTHPLDELRWEELTAD